MRVSFDLKKNAFIKKNPKNIVIKMKEKVSKLTKIPLNPPLKYKHCAKHNE